MTRAAWSIIWKWSVPVTSTGPEGTALEIGNALFPGLALPISHLVTLRGAAKAPITVCESAQSRRLQPGKHFSISEALHRVGSSPESLPTGAWTFKPWIFRIQADTGRACRVGPARPNPTCRLSGSRRRSGCIPAEPYPPLEQLKPNLHPRGCNVMI